MTKKQLAAKERKRAKKAPKNIYANEKMLLNAAIDVLRVRLHVFVVHAHLPFLATSHRPSRSRLLVPPMSS